MFNSLLSYKIWKTIKTRFEPKVSFFGFEIILSCYFFCQILSFWKFWKSNAYFKDSEKFLYRNLNKDFPE